jgi:hypothetical protein
MLRILLIIVFGLFFAMAALKTIGAIIALIVNLSNGGNQAPEILGALTASIVLSLLFGWLFKKVYFQKTKVG